MLVSAVNVSEGRDPALLAALQDATGDECLDVHADPHHHRAVLTLAGERAPRRVAAVAVEHLDLRAHDGVHPRLGVVDVVPFTAVASSTAPAALAARNDFGAWLGDTLHVPGFAYGPDRTLPEVRRRAYRDLDPTWGPQRPHPTAGSTCVGARPPLVAYNVWLVEADLVAARRVAAAVRDPHIRALGLAVGDRVQVSMNLVDPDVVGPAAAYDRVAERVAVAGAELVGLLPEHVLRAIDPARWPTLDLGSDRTIEYRLGRRAAG